MKERSHFSAVSRYAVFGLMGWILGCSSETTTMVGEPSEDQRVDRGNRYQELRAQMVRQQLERRDITDRDVLDAMRAVPRHEFVPERLRGQAYEDHPLPIDQGQTISQPYIVALMTQLAKVRRDSRVLDVGTGSGYQAAVLSHLARQVHSIEIVPELAQQAGRRLRRLEITNVQVRTGDGYQGWPDKAPFDVIIVAAAPDHVPDPLVQQLAVGGRLVIPVGSTHQKLMVVRKRPDGTADTTIVAPVSFVPMTGIAQQADHES